MNTQDIKGLISTLEHYCLTELEYDRVAVSCKIRLADYQFEVNCDDSFQSKGSWDKKVEQILISENFDYETGLDEASKAMFARLQVVMKRAERELRYGLNIIGQSIEAGASYTTHIGLEFVASMKKEQEKTTLMLPNRTAAQPVAETTPDDEIPY